MDVETLRSKTLQVAHSIELSLTEHGCAPHHRVDELKYLVLQIRKRRIPVDSGIRWAISLYTVATYGLKLHQEEGLRPSSHDDMCLGIDRGFVECIVGRRSVRKWTDDNVSKETLESIIDIARWAPSSCNRQPWRVLIVDREEDIRFLSDYFDHTFWRHAKLLMLILMDMSLYQGHHRHYVYLDAGAFIQNILLVAHAMGLGACWVGFNKWDAFGNVCGDDARIKHFCEYFQIKATLLPVSMVAMGDPAHQPNSPVRKAVESILVPRTVA